ncbi:MAG: LuxR family transcriptional regulator, partial [Winogradskyella sp.]|nr:LuxR family transcriptional regulator [Winogradskyella sp.]
MSLKTNILILFSLLGFNLLISQELPPVITYTPDIYGADNQNWSISQSSNKHIYVANNNGLLEFNGENWTLHKSPNETIMRSVLVVGELIYTGCFMEFGFWKKSNTGTLQYTSLSKDLNLIEDEQFWKIIELDGFVLFQSLDRIYIYNVSTKEFRILGTDKKITKMYKVDDSIYFQRQYDGIYRILNGEEQLVFTYPEIINDIVVNIYQKDQGLLFQTQNSGFYNYSNNRIEQWPVNLGANDQLDNYSIYHSLQLKNGNYVLGTVSAGIIVLNNNGELVFRVNQEQGLNNNTVLSTYEDMTNNLWLGLDNGINCININSPFRVFRDDIGKLGTVYCSAIYQGRLYLGTNQGLYSKRLNIIEDYKYIEETKGQVWSLSVIDNQLFCGHNNGTFLIDNDEAIKVSGIEGVWDIKSMPGSNDYLLQGTYSGFYVLQKENARWKVTHKVRGFDRSAKFFEFSSSDELLVNHEYKGVFILTMADNYTSIIEEQEVENTTKAAYSSLFKYGGNVYYAYKNGVYKYIVSEKRFEKDPSLSAVYKPEDYVTGKMISIENARELWGFTTNEIVYVSPGKLTNELEINRLQFPSKLRKTATGYENVSKLTEDKYVFGTTTGYFLLEK